MRRLLLTIATSVLATTMLFVPGASAIEAEPSPDANVDEIDEVRPPRPKIRCHGALTFGGEPKVKCRWTESEHPQAAGYKVVRVSGDVRKVVFRTDDTSVTRFADKDVEFNTRYRYRVVVVNEAGRRLQRSRWNGAIVHKPDTEVLELKCGATDLVARRDALTDVDVATRFKTVACKWSAAESESATEYQLWRLIRGQHRELVATVGIDERRHHLDRVPADTGKVLYAVLALDRHGEIVARSRVAVVRFPSIDG